MHRLVSKLILYRDPEQNSILFRLSRIFADFETGTGEKHELIDRIYEQIRTLLDLASQYGFDGNLWHDYLVFLLLTDENPFTLSCERTDADDHLLNYFAREDFQIFQELFHFDFSPIELSLGIDCFTAICNRHAGCEDERPRWHNIGEAVRTVRLRLEKAGTESEIFNIVRKFYRTYGVGMFGVNRAFRIRGREDGVQLVPICSTDDVRLEDIVGYENQKQLLLDNTKAFVAGKSANNVLLYGDAGTGKSTSIRAVLNELYPGGLRLIEIYKHQFRELSGIISQIKNRNYRFIIYMDDISFEETEIEYKYLKAVIEGGLEARPNNVLIYATSNRRHMVREMWSDRADVSDEEVNRSDTMREKLSLVERFGITINYSRPSQTEYFAIVDALAKKYSSVGLSLDELHRRAVQWELSHGGFSGRAAQQFIDYIAGMCENSNSDGV